MWGQVKIVGFVTFGVILSTLVLSFAWTNRHMVEIKAWAIGSYQLPAWAVLGLGLLMGIVTLLPFVSMLALRMQRRDSGRQAYIISLKKELDMLRNQPLLEDKELVAIDAEQE